MKITVKNILLCAAAALGLCAPGSASAITVGVLDFTAQGNLDPDTFGTATRIGEFFTVNPGSTVNNGTVRVTRTDGVSDPIPEGSLIEANPLHFTTGASPFLSYLGFDFNVDAASISVFRLPFFLNISGTGTITDGTTNIPALFFLSSQGSAPGGFASLSGTIEAQSSDVPEGGSAVLFLGMGLIGVETLRRRMIKARA